LQDADFAAGERRLLNGIVVQKRLPDGEAQGGGHAEQDQQVFGLACHPADSTVQMPTQGQGKKTKVTGSAFVLYSAPMAMKS